jgi:hypothetical protein
MAAKTPRASSSKTRSRPRSETVAASPPKETTTRRSSKGEGGAKKARGTKKEGATAVATQPAERKARKARVPVMSRAMSSIDDDDVLMARGGGGDGFGRCGGRLLSNRLEQQLCNRLSIAGVVHSHSPRHYEIRYDENRVAAYAPMIVLRGRGREGKGVVIEAIEDSKAAILRKIIAFREQYGSEFYVILVAADDVLDEVALTSYDESCASSNVNTLIARLAE